MSIPKISAPVLWFMRGIVRGYFRRHFTAVRLRNAEHFVNAQGPLIVYANHSSWWDPMVCLLLADKLMRDRRHFAPMDAASLNRYAILRHIGIFPVEMKSARGGVQFLRNGEDILETGGVLWVTPQGRFVDTRQRPLEFKPGLATLARRVAKESGSCTVLPLAIEYSFWDERLPETLLHFGEAVRVTPSSGAAIQVQTELVSALETTMRELQAMSFERSPAPFSTLMGGTLGTGGFYSLGKRFKALLQREPYRPEHASVVQPESATGWRK